MKYTVKIYRCFTFSCNRVRCRSINGELGWTAHCNIIWKWKLPYLAGADLEGGIGEGGKVRNNPPWKGQTMHLRYQHFKILRIIKRIFFMRIFQIFADRCELFKNLQCTIATECKCIYVLTLLFENVVHLLGNFKVVHRSYNFCGCAEQPYTL